MRAMLDVSLFWEFELWSNIAVLKLKSKHAFGLCEHTLNPRGAG
jgi:hypothetical protein